MWDVGWDGVRTLVAIVLMSWCASVRLRLAWLQPEGVQHQGGSSPTKKQHLLLMRREQETAGCRALHPGLVRQKSLAAET